MVPASSVLIAVEISLAIALNAGPSSASRKPPVMLMTEAFTRFTSREYVAR